MSEFGESLQKDFEEVAAKITAKLNEAAAAIEEASAMAKQSGLGGVILTERTDPTEAFYNLLEQYLDEDDDEINQFIHDLYGKIDASSLEKVLNNAGWNTSSSYC